MGKDAVQSNGIPLWIRVWLFITGVICTWDATFILFRPHSLPGGKYSLFWKPYSIYVAVDKRYGDLKDPFVYAQSLLNLVEVVMGFIALLLHVRNSRHTAAVALSVSLLTFWKTTLYMLQYTDLCGGGHYHSHNDAFTNFLYLWLPNGIWMVVPFLSVCRLWGRITRGTSEKRGDGGQMEEKSAVSGDVNGRPVQKAKKKMY